MVLDAILAYLHFSAIFVLFAFLSAMFGIVFANNLAWFLVFWEVTTFCSFILIGYTRTTEAIDNAFLAVVLNLVGGIGFLAWRVISPKQVVVVKEVQVPAPAAVLGRGTSRTTGTANAWKVGRRGVLTTRVMAITGAGDGA